MLLCRLFGHTHDADRYVKCNGWHVIDGCEREHVELVAVCSRCKQPYDIGRLHLPERFAEQELRAENQRLRDLCRCGEGI